MPGFPRRNTIPHAVALVLASLLFEAAFAQPPGGATQPPPVIARVEGRPITQQDFDRLAAPYVAQLRQQLGPSFTPDLQRTAMKNVLDELIRREVLMVEFNRRGLPVSEEETDALLRQDPFFQTNGRFDETKFRQFKISPGSNYLQVLPRIREMAGANKVDSIVRAQLAPSRAQIRAEWDKRNETARISVLALNTREQSLEPEATAEEQRDYYETHLQEFERPTRLRLRYLRLQLPSADDSTRTEVETATRDRVRGLADSLRAGTPLDSLAGGLVLGPEDTGLLTLPVTTLPGLGSPAVLLSAIARADSDTTVRVIGPVSVDDWVVLAEIAERHGRAPAPYGEVRADVKRRADLDKRRSGLEEEKRAYYEAHRDDFAEPRVALTRVTVPESGVRTKWPATRDIELWYRKNGLRLFDDSTLTAPPPMTDSLRGVSREHLMAERRIEQAQRDAQWVAGRWRPDREPDDLARKVGAGVEHLSLAGKAVADSLFAPAFLDSLMRMPEVAKVGTVQGPRRFFEHAVAWRVDSLDADYVRPLAEVDDQIQRAVLEERRLRDEHEAEQYFETRRAAYKTKVKYVLDYVMVPIPPPDSVSVPEEDLRRTYDSRIEEFREPEGVRARHILISTRGTDAAAAKARIDSLHAAIEAGADFAELARTFSQDPGSAPNGGDLGFFSRGRMVPPFEEAAFALQPGQVSAPVQTQFGWHIIKLEEHRDERVAPFDEVRDRLRLELAQARGDSVARDGAAALRARLAKGGAPDSVIAARYGGVHTSAPFPLDESMSGVGFVNGLAGDVTQKSVGRWLAKVYRAGTGYLVAKPVKHVPPQPAEFAEVKSQVLDDWRSARRTEVLDAKAARVMAALAAGASLDSVAAPLGGLKAVGPVFAGATFVPQVGADPRLVAEAFKLDVGAVSDSLHNANGVVWLRVDERGTRQGASFDKEREAIREELLNAKYRDWVDRRRKTMSVEILRPELR